MLRMSEVDHQAMQHMLTSSAIDWNGLGEQIARETDALLGGLEAILIIDESGFAKKGEASAGVARQWNGRLGKVDNCQHVPERHGQFDWCALVFAGTLDGRYGSLQ